MIALASGQVISDRYLLLESIGEGAMGAVFRAEDQTLKRNVAIKFLFVRAMRDPQQMVDQFLREARIAASVQHRNVIQTVDFGTVDQFQPFMVMELLSGESLGDRLAREPALTRDQLVHIVSLTLRGLAAVHDAGIVHRDLKPQNIFLQRDAEAVYPKILDFGISRSVEASGERPSAIATQEGLIIGTPDYMSPEQARGEAGIDKRSDIYSMGVVLYEGLTGRPPFEANSIGELIMQIMTVEPKPVAELRPDVPQALSDLVAQAMAKDREQRFADARALRRALLAIAEAAQSSGRRALSLPPLEHAQAQAAPRASNASPVPARAAAPGAAGVDLAGPVSTTAATWGDFEGLNARQIIDKSLPPPVPAHARASLPAGSPQQQRVVSDFGDIGDRLSAPPRPAVQPRQNASAERAPAQAPARRSRGSSGKIAAAPGASLDVALDPLYSGSEQAAPDIDYARAGISAKKAAPAAQPRAAAQVRAQRPRAKPLNELPHARSRRSFSWGPWLLPVMALLLLGYFLYGRDQAASGLESSGLRSAASAAGSAVARKAAGTDVQRVLVRDKARRTHAGVAAPHMRDVVF